MSIIRHKGLLSIRQPGDQTDVPTELRTIGAKRPGFFRLKGAARVKDETIGEGLGKRLCRWPPLKSFLRERAGCIGKDTAPIFIAKFKVVHPARCSNLA